MLFFIKTPPNRQKASDAQYDMVGDRSLFRFRPLFPLAHADEKLTPAGARFALSAMLTENGDNSASRKRVEAKAATSARDQGGRSIKT
jgi:hypothetical protein